MFVNVPHRRPVIGRTTAVILAALAAPTPATAQPPPAVPVAVAPVVRREVAAGQDFVGSVMALRTSTVGSAVEERVVEFPINEGDRVRKGDVLARLRTRTLEIELAAARAELEVRKQELAELENGSRPEEIEQGRARLASARALRDLARIRRQRAINLRQSGSITPEELDEAVSEAEQAEQSYQEADSALALLVEGPRAEQIARARAQVLVQEEQCRRLEDLVENHTIVAPFDGYIVAEHTEVGQWVAKGQPIAEMVELDAVEITVPVLEDYVAYLTVGTAVRVEVGALPDRSFTGEIASIVPQADLRSRSFPVKVRVANEERDGVVVLKAGMFARVTLPVGERQEGLLVPKDALVLGGPAPVVFVVDASSGEPDKGTVRPVPVQLGVADGDMIQVLGALEEGDRVVVQGNERLRPGQGIAVIQPGAAARTAPRAVAPESRPAAR